MPRKQLLYRNMGERITAAEAKRKYMNPRLNATDLHKSARAGEPIIWED